ncbi:hypothetical protein LOTGIDRAFT_128667, partial [Lottia gigantea]
ILTYISIQGLSPIYLSDLIETKKGLCTRSTTRKDLVVPKTLRAYPGDRAFSVAAPVLWNNLPKHVLRHTYLLVNTRIWRL